MEVCRGRGKGKLETRFRDQDFETRNGRRWVAQVPEVGKRCPKKVIGDEI